MTVPKFTDRGQVEPIFELSQFILLTQIAERTLKILNHREKRQKYDETPKILD